MSEPPAVGFNLTQTPTYWVTYRSTDRPYTQELAIALKVLAPMWPAILIFGLTSNIINIIVFLKAGVKENVTTLLLSLAISDFTFLVLMTPTMSGMSMKAYANNHAWPFDSKFSLYFFYWPAFTAYDLSAFISVSLGVMRCACVAMPLQFKLVFTKSRTICWVLFLVALAVSLRIPVLTIFRVVLRKNPLTNVSSPYLVMVNQASMSRINDVMNRGFVIWLNYSTMVSCVSVLSLKLYQASKMRRSFTVQMSQNSEKPDKEYKGGLQAKDIQVIKSVVLVGAIFIFSQLPFLFVSTFRLANAQFSTDTKLRNLFTIISQVSLTLSYLNASLNIFVYYNYNSRYREVFLSLLISKQTK